MSAKKALMEKLHSLLAETLTDQIENGVEVLNKQGDLVTVSTPAAVLSVARQFLSDNGIEAVGDTDTLNKLGSITSKLPFSQPDEHGLTQ